MEYDRLIMEWLAAGRPVVSPADENRLATVKELILAYWKFAQKHYRKDGKPTGSAERLKPILVQFATCTAISQSMSSAPCPWKLCSKSGLR